MLSYNEREIIQETWQIKKISKHIPQTLDEDLEWCHLLILMKII
jgi:hypothetical protein